MPRVVGKITNTHGIKGDLKVEPYIDNVDKFYELRTAYLDKHLSIAYEVISVKKHKKIVLIRFKGYEDINLVEKFKDLLLYVDDNSTLSVLDEDEFSENDLLGAFVFDEDENMLGKVVDIINNPTQDLLVIEGNKTWYLPFVNEFILDIDLENSKIIIKLLDGLNS